MEASPNNIVLIQQARRYADENRVLSWWCTLSTFMLLSGVIISVFLVELIWVRLSLSVLIGLLIVRGFILYHDFFHGAILVKSKAAMILFSVYGLFVLSPARVWKETHNFHHAHTAVLDTSNIGSFWIVTTDCWRNMSWIQRLKYRIARHQITILLGYFTIFLYGLCIHGFLRRPTKNWDAPLAIATNISLVVLASVYSVLDLYFFAWLLPSMIAGAVGSYLFYAQHNFPGMTIRAKRDWSYTHAALHSTAYINMTGLMRWFTGNIGIHHVHHVNHRIPFYRLPEAMTSIEAFRQPYTTSLSLKDVMGCFRQQLWDKNSQRMVTFREALNSSN